MYITLQNLQNTAKLKKIIATLDRVSLKSSAIKYEKQQPINIEENNRVLQQLGIPPITTSLRGNNDSARRLSRQVGEEDGDYMPLEDEGPDNAAAAATRASTIRTRGTRRQANDVLLSHELGISPITTTLGGNNDSTQRQSRQANEEDGDYMPLEDEGPDNTAATATKASKRITTAYTRTIRTRATSRQANDVMLSSVDVFDGSSQQVRRDNAPTSSVRQDETSQSISNQIIEEDNQINSPKSGGSSSKRGKTKCQIWKRKRDANSGKAEVELPVELGHTGDGYELS